MNHLTLCRKALPIVVVFALLVCSNSGVLSAQSGGLSASAQSSFGSISGRLIGGSAGVSAQMSDGHGGGSPGSPASGEAGMSGSASSLQQQQQQLQPPASGSASASASLISGEEKKGLLDKLGDAAKRGKDMLKETAKEVKDVIKPEEKNQGGGGSGSGGVSAGGSVKLGGASIDAKVQLGGGGGSGSGGGSGGGSGSSNPISKLMSKGSEMVHKMEDKASQLGEKLIKPLADTGGSQGEDKGVAVEVIDKVHNMSKTSVEHAMEPIDKALGIKKDPLVKALDDSHEMLRHPVSVISKPVEQVLSGAFKTTDESKQEQEKQMSEEQKKEAKMREELARKEGRTVLGEITDKTVELAEQPIAFILRPVDRILGFDKEGKKNPLIKIVDEIYGLSKKPLDALARPFENILRKMADGEQAYQVSVRIGADGPSSRIDPKLFTRLADGALNIADRVVSKPIELAMRPLGYDNKKKKNPILDAAHSLKNATKVGLELLTKPLDRIIKEIAEIGTIKDDAEREALIERKRQEASRIVSALDKIHEVAQQPFEIVLKPIGRVLGYNRDGKKEPLLRAWDIVHQVVRTPVQVLSKPVEDAILGESKRPRMEVKAKVDVNGKNGGVSARVGAGQGGGSGAQGAQGAKRKNFFVEQIKKVEKFATKPLNVITSPIRKLILGEDDKQKLKLGPLELKAGAKEDGGPDKIVNTVEAINNVVLKPIEVMTQPISDVLTTDEGKLKNKVDIKIGASGQSKGQEKGQPSPQPQAPGAVSGSGSGHTSGSGSGSIAATVSGHTSGSGSSSGSAFGSASASGQSSNPDAPSGSMSASASGKASGSGQGSMSMSASGHASGSGPGSASASGHVLATPGNGGGGGGGGLSVSAQAQMKKN